MHENRKSCVLLILKYIFKEKFSAQAIHNCSRNSLALVVNKQQSLNPEKTGFFQAQILEKTSVLVGVSHHRREYWLGILPCDSDFDLS